MYDNIFLEKLITSLILIRFSKKYMYVIVVSHGMQISYENVKVCVLKKKVFLLVAGGIAYNTILKSSVLISLTVNATLDTDRTVALRICDVEMKSN